MVTTRAITTADELFEAGDIGRCELIRGQLVMMTPAGGEHARLTTRVALRVGNYVEQRRLGLVYAGDPGFIIERDPDTVRAPDVAFIAADRAAEMHTRRFMSGVPDLAVEVVSPDDRPKEVIAKAKQWIAAGCKLVWVVDPSPKTISVYRPDGSTQLLYEADELHGDAVLPGFVINVADIFAF